MQTKGKEGKPAERYVDFPGPIERSLVNVLACEGQLPMLDRIQKERIYLTNICSSCRKVVESNWHIIIECMIVQEVWKWISPNFGSRQSSSERGYFRA